MAPLPTVYRYEVCVRDEVELPAGVLEILSAKRSRDYRNEQHACGVIEIWARVCLNEECSHPPVRALIRGTGHPLTREVGRFVDTILDGELVWHVFQSA